MSEELPKGWASCSVHQAFVAFGGGTPDKRNATFWGGAIPWLSSGDIKSEIIETGSESITLAGLDNSSARLCRPGSVLVVVRSGILKHTLPVALLGREAAINQDIKCFDSGNDALNQWLALALRAYSNDILALNREGTTVQSVKYETLREFAVPVPPLPEQRRIVAKLEALLTKVDTCQKRLAKIPVLLKRFRQSVLAAACSGRLTADWREGNPDFEPASNLLEKIRERRVEAARSDKEKSRISAAFEGQNLRLDDGEGGISDMPESWVACRVGAIGSVCNGSTPSRKVPEYWGEAIPWVSSGEVRNNVISVTRERITESGFEGCSVRLLPRGTVLLAMIGEGKTRGQSAILDVEATINQNIAAVILDHGLVLSRYLWRWFQLQYQATREQGSGSGPQALNCQSVRELPFVLPPISEQNEIVRRVDALFALADQIESRYAKAKAQVDKLTQSILAKAFRGELVPQNPNDEPAPVLLERIRAERITELPKRGHTTKARQSRTPSNYA